MTELTCQYCGQPAKLISSTEIYGEDHDYGMLWACMPCDAYCGTKNDNITPHGSLANAELRKWRKKAHAAFDPLWKNKHFRSRGKAYSWLADRMNLRKGDTHMGMFNIEQCNQVVEHCRYFKSKSCVRYSNQR